MKSKPLPSWDEVHAELAYTPASPSGLVWRKSRGRAKVGTPAGYVCPQGYAQVRLWGRILKAHRLVWLLCTGRDPGALEIDHIDGDPRNNAISNLRLATHAENARNKGAHGQTSRFNGVSWNGDKGRWVAQLRSANGRFRGYFDDELSAARAYNEAARRVYGEFARLNEVDVA